MTQQSRTQGIEENGCPRRAGAEPQSCSAGLGERGASGTRGETDRDAPKLRSAVKYTPTEIAHAKFPTAYRESSQPIACDIAKRRIAVGVRAPGMGGSSRPAPRRSPASARDPAARTRTSAGPAPLRTTLPAASNSPAAAVPIAPKIPAPITAPMASMTRSPALSTRFSPSGPASRRSSDIGLREKSWDMPKREEGRGKREVWYAFSLPSFLFPLPGSSSHKQRTSTSERVLNNLITHGATAPPYP